MDVLGKLDETYLWESHGARLKIRTGTSQQSPRLFPAVSVPMDYVRHASLMSSAPNQDDWIRVTSRDGFSFIVKRNVVFRSGTLRNMLDERRTYLVSLPAPPLTPHAPPQIASQRLYKKSVP